MRTHIYSSTKTHITVPESREQLAEHTVVNGREIAWSRSLDHTGLSFLSDNTSQQQPRTSRILLHRPVGAYCTEDILQACSSMFSKTCECFCCGPFSIFTNTKINILIFDVKYILFWFDITNEHSCSTHTEVRNLLRCVWNSLSLVVWRDINRAFTISETRPFAQT